jgi:hypothetical protein
MPENSFMLFGYENKARISWDVQKLQALGGNVWPRLFLQVPLTIRPIKQEEQSNKGNKLLVSPISVIQTSGLFYVNPLDCISAILPYYPSIRTYANGKEGNGQVNLEIPISPSLLTAIEGVRKGSDLRCRIRLDILVAMHQEEIPHTDYRVGSPIVCIEQSQQWLEFTIPQSQWAIDLLPKLGYGSRYVLEIPIPEIPAKEGYTRALKKLEEAWSAYRQGSDAEVLKLCYNLWEAFVKELNLGNEPDQNAFDNYLGQTDFAEEKRQKLKQFFKYLCQLTQIARHEGKVDICADHKDAELVLLTTQIGLAYLAKIVNNNTK